MGRKNLIIAIDGHSSCGKSTLAKDLAKYYNYIYVDSGAMYRAATLYFLENNINYNDPIELKEALDQIEIHFELIEGKNICFLNGRNVEKEIREPRVSDEVSPVATLLAVRKKMVGLQRSMAKSNHGLVMDGRDIGTVVFPNADVKLYVTAKPDIRTKRRHLELLDRGVDISFEAVKKNLLERDMIDSTRTHSPLKMANDAILIDNSDMNLSEQLNHVLSIIDKQYS